MAYYRQLIIAIDEVYAQVEVITSCVTALLMFYV